MISREEVEELRYSKETARVERTISTGDMDKLQARNLNWSQFLTSSSCLSTSSTEALLKFRKC